MRPLFLHRRQYPAAPRQAVRPVVLTTGCTGSCFQGAPCDCAADLPRRPLSRAERVLLVLIWTVSASLSVSFGWWLVSALRGVA